MQKAVRPLRLVYISMVASLTACGGSNEVAPLPQLSAAQPGTLGNCTGLSAFAFPNTTISAATSVAAGTLTVAGTPVPAHCLVTGSMYPRTSAVDGQAYAIGFQMRMPMAWSGRFFYQGNGGIDGTVSTAVGASGGGPLTNALLQGFAVISSDAGHSGAQNPTFGIDPQARLDYGYQAVGKLTPMAKALVAAAYGRAPDRSYIGGCSNGGRHTAVAASRYAADYDGYLVGDPGLDIPRASAANMAGAQAYAALATNPADLSTGFTLAERALVSSAVLDKCDALDGSADGLVQDTMSCQAAFDLSRDVPTCSATRDGTCLSAAQKTAIGQLFAGAKSQTGATINKSFAYDAGLATSGWALWKFTFPLLLDPGSAIFFSVPPADPAGFNGPNFALNANFDSLLASEAATNVTYTESANSFMTPPHPTDLGALKNRGAKMMIYHGTSDPIFPVQGSIDYYEGLRSANAGDASNFSRMFLIPGMNHCSGGPAADQFDMLTPLVNWVERGQAPDSVVASVRGPGNAGTANADVPSTWSASRTRPLCAYPKIARYLGAGSIESASSFACQ